MGEPLLHDGNVDAVAVCALILPSTADSCASDGHRLMITKHDNFMITNARVCLSARAQLKLLLVLC